MIALFFKMLIKVLFLPGDLTFKSGMLLLICNYEYTMRFLFSRDIFSHTICSRVDDRYDAL